MKKIWLYGNWKMNKTISETRDFITNLSTQFQSAERSLSGLQDRGMLEMAVFPSFTALYSANLLVRKMGVDFLKIGAQNLYFEVSGAFTGEVSCSMISETGSDRVLIGHSERRHVFCEPDDLIASKMKACISNNLVPILCYGEVLEERDKGLTLNVVKRQIVSALEGLDISGISEKVILAYEPVWAIGTGRSARPEDAQEVCSFTRDLLGEIIGKEEASKTPILYGGSVKPSNGRELLSQEDVNGVLVGGASLKVDSFLGILGSYLSS